MNCVVRGILNVNNFCLRLMSLIKTFSSLVFVILSININAQELKLFEETESNNGGVNEKDSRPVRRDGSGNVITGPEFTLIGTTRIGGNSLVVLEDQLGEVVSIRIPVGASASIPDYPEFQVVDVGAGNAAIKFPRNNPCIEFRNLGVSCEAVDLARLVLTNAKPLERVSEGMMLNSGGNTESLPEGAIDQENESNPFEAILRRAANPDSRGEETAFEPRRIKPEDVPPGMRVVSTPFGDRLVEQE